MNKCDICFLDVEKKENLIRISNLNLKGSEDDFVCYSCKKWLSNIAKHTRDTALACHYKR